jgi:hypothetical protein
MIGKLAAQKRQMRLTPGRYPFAIVAVGRRAAHHQQQNLRQGMRPPPRIARIVDDGEMIEKRSKARLLSKTAKARLMAAAPESNRHSQSLHTQSVNSR